MEKITLRDIERDLDSRHLYMQVTSNVELKNARLKWSWIATIRSTDCPKIVSARRGSERAAKQAAYEALIAKER